MMLTQLRIKNNHELNQMRQYSYDQLLPSTLSVDMKASFQFLEVAHQHVFQWTLPTQKFLFPGRIRFSVASSCYTANSNES